MKTEDKTSLAGNRLDRSCALVTDGRVSYVSRGAPIGLASQEVLEVRGKSTSPIPLKQVSGNLRRYRAPVTSAGRDATLIDTSTL